MARNGNDHRIIFPEHFGYYMKRELDPLPHEVNMETFQLDRALIQEINKTEGGYTFSGTVEDYGIQHAHQPILRNTVVLENYVEKIEPRRSDNKLRIFSRGGTLCNFLAGNDMRFPPSTLDFEYDEAENILRFMDTTTNCSQETPFDYTCKGKHRLTGNTGELIHFGKNNIYRVMKLTTDDFELFYSKEVDGFDGEEPIEFRGVRKNWYLNGRKLGFKSSALAEIKKIVILIESEGDNVVERVSISDDFPRIYMDPDQTRDSLFRRMNTFFNEYIPILKQLISGKITRGNGGTVIEPIITELWENVRVVSTSHANPLGDDEKAIIWLNYPNATRDLLHLIQSFGPEGILACFLESNHNVDAHYPYALFHYWRSLVAGINPNLTWPLDLVSRDICTYSPFFHTPPIIKNCLTFNNETWTLSRTNNTLIGRRREDIQDLLQKLTLPLPVLPGRIPMKVLSQEPCKDLLQEFFGQLITFKKPSANKPVIFCTIIQIHEEDFCSAISARFPKHPANVHSADLYLIGRQPVINQTWNNKNDLEYLTTFEGREGLDPIRKLPETIALISKEQDEIMRVDDILKETYDRILAIPRRNYVIY